METLYIGICAIAIILIIYFISIDRFTNHPSYIYGGVKLTLVPPDIRTGYTDGALLVNNSKLYKYNSAPELLSKPVKPVPQQFYYNFAPPSDRLLIDY